MNTGDSNFQLAGNLAGKPQSFKSVLGPVKSEQSGEKHPTCGQLRRTRREGTRRHGASPPAFGSFAPSACEEGIAGPRGSAWLGRLYSLL